MCCCLNPCCFICCVIFWVFNRVADFLQCVCPCFFKKKDRDPAYQIVGEHRDHAHSTTAERYAISEVPISFGHVGTQV